jgi:hypothetical protein
MHGESSQERDRPFTGKAVRSSQCTKWTRREEKKACHNGTENSFSANIQKNNNQPTN